MPHLRFPLLGLSLLFACTASLAHDEDQACLSLHGFGTVAIVHSGERNVDYIGSLFSFRPKVECAITRMYRAATGSAR